MPHKEAEAFNNSSAYMYVRKNYSKSVKLQI